MKKLPWFLAGLCALCLCVSLIYNANTHRHFSQTSDIITFHDTLVITEPVVKDSVVLCYRTITLPAKHDTVTLDNIVVQVDTVTDSVHVSLPITQKEYEDSSYHAWVSGFQPNLDSIAVYPKTTIITNTITQTVTKTKRWGVGVQIGMGVSEDKKVHPFVGIGINYNIFSW